MGIVERLNILKKKLDEPKNDLKRANKELKEELEFYEWIGIKHYERPYAKKYLEEKRKERPNLLYPDSEEIYKDFYEAKEEIERLNKNYERIYNENCKLRKEHNITDISLLDENDKLHSIIKEVSEELKIIKELEDFNVVKLQLTNIIFRLDKENK